MAANTTKILIVEDMAVVARDIKFRLEYMGYTVVGTVDNGPDSIKMAELGEPDIILMDITLKGEMDGFEAAREIAAISNVPVIFLTAHTDQSTLDSGREISSHGIFTKPFSEEELNTAIQQAMISNAIKQQIDKDNKLQN